jgi:hypothetical protein
MATRYNKIVVGLALVNELHIRKASHDLLDVYGTPSMGQLGGLRDHLSTSTDVVDQETALFLDLALDRKPFEVDLPQLLVTLKEIEVLLFEFMWQVSEAAQRDMNDWYNYLVNTSQNLQDGDFFDAKILANRAYESAKRVTVDNLPSKFTLRGNIGILRKGTLDAFHKIREIPVRLRVPEDRHEMVVEGIEILIASLTLYWENGETTTSSTFSIMIQKVNAALRSMMRDVDTRDALTEICVAIEVLEEWQNTLSGGELSDWAERIHLRLSKLRDRVKTVGQGGTIH